MVNLVLSHSKTQLPLNAGWAKRDGVSYNIILNIKRFVIALNRIHFQARKMAITSIL